MSSQSHFIFAAAMAASAFSIDTNASIDVYTQAVTGVGGATSAILSAAGDPGFNWTTDTDQEMWNYFHLASDVTFNRITWYGSKADANFGVDLVSATCVSCNASPVGGSGTFSNSPFIVNNYLNSAPLLPDQGPFTQGQVHETQVSAGLYSYYIDLSSAITLDHTQPYFALSIVNNYTQDKFNWASSNASGSYVKYNIGQAMFLAGAGSMAFTLTNTAVSAVPLPASFWLLGSGLVCLFSVNRQGKKVC